MAFKKLNPFEKLYLKNTNKDAYQNYKYQLKVSKIPSINFLDTPKPLVDFKHSGHLGDIIYAIPTMYALAENGKARLHLNIGQKIKVDGEHPLQGIGLNEKSILMLEPLLTHQQQFQQIDIYDKQEIDYDLDVFRKFPFDYSKGHISRWYFNCFAVSYDLSKPWLTIPKDNSMADKIVIARSTRYNSPVIDYSILKKYNNLVFVGLPEEYALMKAVIPHLVYVEVSNFFELAKIIAGAKLFIGNQSFPYAIAEALKTPRMLESYYKSPNVIPEGPNAFEFSFQPQFEFLAQKLILQH